MKEEEVVEKEVGIGRKHLALWIVLAIAVIILLIIIFIFIARTRVVRQAVPEVSPETPKEVFLAYISAAEKNDLALGQIYLSDDIIEQLRFVANVSGESFDMVLQRKLEDDLRLWNEVLQLEAREEIAEDIAFLNIKSKPDSPTSFMGNYSFISEDDQWKIGSITISL